MHINLAHLPKAGRADELDNVCGKSPPSKTGICAVMIIRQRKAECECSYRKVTLGVATG